MSSESFIKLAMIQLMLHRLEPSDGDSLARNLALYPVVLGHGFRRLMPF